MNEQKNLNLETLESALEGKQAESKKRKAPYKVRLPKAGEAVVFCGKLYHFQEFALSEEDVEFVVLHEYASKRGQCLGIPKEAFRQEFTNQEFVYGEKTGKTFSYKPDHKSQTITLRNGNGKEAIFYYPDESTAKAMQAEKDAKDAERKAKAEARKAAKAEAKA